MRNLMFYILGINVLLFGCSKYLDKDPIGKLTEREVQVDPTEGTVTAAVENAYRPLANTLNIFGNWNWDGGLVIRPDFILEDMGAGDVMKTWVPNGEQPWMDEIVNYNFTSENGTFAGIWKYDYEGISRANLAIFLLTDPTSLAKINIDENKRKQLLAEVFFLRSFYYFDLVKNFGDVPLLLTPLKDFNEAYEVAFKTPKSKVYEQIKADLETAASYFPNARFSNQSEKWRASKGAALALLAKIALYENNWLEVLENINALESLGIYDLNAHFFDSFDNSKAYSESENIFIYDHETGKQPSRGNGIGALLGWGFVAPTESLLNAFESNDPRKELTVNVGDKSVYKLLGAQNTQFKGDDNSPANRVFIRYTDVLLWKAEALIKNQQIPAGIAIINQVRARARGGNTSILANYSTLGVNEVTAMQWLQQERRVELAFESHRLSDLRRWGIAKSTLISMGKAFQDKHILYPIPQLEVDKTSGTISQNPGY